VRRAARFAVTVWHAVGRTRPARSAPVRGPRGCRFVAATPTGMFPYVWPVSLAPPRPGCRAGPHARYLTRETRARGLRTGRPRPSPGPRGRRVCARVLVSRSRCDASHRARAHIQIHDSRNAPTLRRAHRATRTGGRARRPRPPAATGDAGVYFVYRYSCVCMRWRDRKIYQVHRFPAP
jgi:hypothetical protein